MTQFTSTRVAIILIAFGQDIRSIMAQSHPTAELTLAQIRREFHERSQAIRTMRIQYRKMPQRDKDGDYRSDVEPQQFEWVVSANKQLLKRDPWLDPRWDKEFPNSPNRGLPPASQWNSYDGRTGYQVIHWPNNPETTSKIFRTHSLPQALRQHGFAQYFGFQLPGSYTTLAEQFERPDTIVHGHESVDEVECIRVQWGSYESLQGTKHDLVVWLDEGHDYVVRRMHILPSRYRDVVGTHENPLRIESGDISFGFYVVTLTSAPDMIAKKDRWFPASWSSSPDGLPYLIMDEISINQTIDPQEFIPKLTLGAEVVDISKNSKGQESFIVGGDEGLALRRSFMDQNRIPELRNKNSEQFTSNPAVGSNPTNVKEWNALPPTTSWLPQMVWVASILSFIVSIGIVYRRRNA